MCTEFLSVAGVILICIPPEVWFAAPTASVVFLARGADTVWTCNLYKVKDTAIYKIMQYYMFIHRLYIVNFAYMLHSLDQKHRKTIFYF